MRTKNFILILCCMLVTSLIYIILNPAGEPNDSFKSIVTQTHHQFNKLQENLRVAEQKKLEIDAKYLAILGFTTSDTTQVNQKQATYFGYNIASDQRQQTQSQIPVDIDIHHLPLQPKNAASMQLQSASEGPHVTTTPYNGTKANFTIVTYVQDGQAPSAILLSQNIAAKFPNEYLLIYDLGISEEESHSLTAYCNSSKCSVINYDLSVFPSHVTDQRMHAFRPIVIKDALMRSKSILFAENYIRIRGTSRDLYELQSKATSGVLGWSTPTAVSARTHPKMFDYFQTNADNFFFMRMVDMDTVFFSDSAFVTEKILLPWLKCALTVECIDPIGAQSNGCKYNKKPLYRYSGCHAYDASAFNIVLGLWHHDESKYSLPSEENKIFYKETLEQATKNLESRRRNSSETSEHPYPFTED